MLENDALNVVAAAVVVVVDEKTTGSEYALSHSAWAGQRAFSGRRKDEAGGRAGAGGQRAGDQTDLSERRRRRRHRKCQLQSDGHRRHSRFGQSSRRRLHDRLERSQSEQDRRGALIHFVHLHNQLGENRVRSLHV